ncbi:MAG: diacylglycerol kinase, partial [Candidatus Chloroheliales bacterium]
TSGGGRALKQWPIADAYLRSQHNLPFSYQYAFTSAPGEAVKLAADAAQAGYRLVVAVGGDGTINEVVNGLFRSGPPPADLQLGVVQAGRGSDFGRTVGVPSDMREALARLIEGRRRRIDIGRMTYHSAGRDQQRGKELVRYFANVAGVGFDAEVAARADRGRQAIGRVLGGSIPYLTALGLSLLRYRNRRMIVEADGVTLPTPAPVYSVVVANCQFFGGGMRVAPDADPADGLFDVVILGNFGKLEVVRELPKLYEGSHLALAKVSVSRARQVVVRAANPHRRLIAQADGEVVGRTPITFDLLPATLTIRV